MAPKTKKMKNDEDQSKTRTEGYMALTAWENFAQDFSSIWSSFWCCENFKFDLPIFPYFRAEMATRKNSNGQNSVNFPCTSISTSNHPKQVSSADFVINQSEKIKIRWWWKFSWNLPAWPSQQTSLVSADFPNSGDWWNLRAFVHLKIGRFMDSQNFQAILSDRL